MKKGIIPKEETFEVWEVGGRKDSKPHSFWGEFKGFTGEQIADKFHKYAFPNDKLSHSAHEGMGYGYPFIITRGTDGPNFSFNKWFVVIVGNYEKERTN